MDHIAQLEMMKVNGFDMGLDNPDYEALDAAIDALRAVREAPVVYTVLQVGNRGAAYDPPNARRAFTYAEQPGNIHASQMGRAMLAASRMSAGDSIDQGLALLKALQSEGFGVFQIDPALVPVPHDSEVVR